MSTSNGQNPADFARLIQQAKDRLHTLLWNAYHQDNWDTAAIEEIKSQIKLISELLEKDREYWEGFNEPDLK